MPYRALFDTRQFDLELSKREYWVRRISSKAVKETSKILYDRIFNNWPVETWWSRANHHVIVNGDGHMPLEPEYRPSESGALESAAQINRTEQKAILDSAVNVTHVLIGNTVPYSPDVGHSPSRGFAIYKQQKDAASNIAYNEVPKIIGKMRVTATE